MSIRLAARTHRRARHIFTRPRARGSRFGVLVIWAGVLGLTTLFVLRPWSGGRTADAPEQTGLAPAIEHALRLGASIPSRYHGAHVSSPPAGFSEPLVALTFDDGPHPDVTVPILTILSNRGIRATFFVLGLQAEKYPEIAARVAAEGHVLANHSYSHRVNTAGEQTAKELDRTETLIYQAAGDSPLLFRPPEGRTDTALTSYAIDQGFTIVRWCVDSEDWKHPSAETIVANCMRDMRPGAIVVLHDGGGGYPDTPGALPLLLDRLASEGYTFVTVPEMLQAWDRFLSQQSTESTDIS